MTIDKAKLIELLVERTGLEKEKVEEQLLQLIRRIQQAAGQGKSFQIEGLGTFDVSNDTLHFNPADTLETEINHKYAGMKPIELIGAFKEVPPVEEEEPETSLEDQVQKEFSEKEDTAEEILGIQELFEPPVTPEEPVADSTEESEKEDNEKKVKASFVFDAEGAKEEQKSESENKEPADAQPAQAQRIKKESKDPIGAVITVCVIVLGIGVFGWLIYDLGLLNTLSTNMQLTGQEEQTVQSASGQSGDPLEESSLSRSSTPSEEVASENGTSGTSEQQLTNTVSSEEGASTQAETSVYGLMGTATTRGNNGYTIVVHSLGSKSTSQAIQRNLTSEGYRTVLTNAFVNGSTFWRIGLGQFETISDAQKATNMLPEQYKSNHFIKRIQ